MTSLKSFSLFVIAAAIGVAGCTTKKTEAPDLSGPSERGTSIALVASPDTLSQDGTSTSQIVIQTRDGNGQPLKNLTMRVEIAVNNTLTDFGHLSERTVTTGGDGRATVTYTAPAAVDTVDRQTMVEIRATPISGDALGNTFHSVSIRLVPSGTVGGGETQVPDFVFTPQAPKQLESVLFDASDPALNSVLVRYDWDFGDGSQSSGRSASHQFRTSGTFSVTLTVTDTAGLKGSRSKSVIVGTSGDPTAAFVFSPATPGVGEEIVFNASSSTAVAPRTIVSYEWQFGTDRTGSGMIVTKTYDTPATYTVTLTVTDDAGNKATAAQGVTVGNTSPGGLAANFTFSPTDPAPNTPVNFNASTSTGADPIVDYSWNFGDGATANGSSPTRAHTFAVAGSYVVTLTVRDSKSRTALTSQTVSVGSVGATVPVASFAASPSPSLAGGSVTFDSRSSVGSNGGVIVEYQWNFGDSASITTTTAGVTSHTYVSPGTYSVTLQVLDNFGKTGTVTKSQIVN
jgi:PKD repeat protein